MRRAAFQRSLRSAGKTLSFIYFSLSRIQSSIASSLKTPVLRDPKCRKLPLLRQSNDRADVDMEGIRRVV